MSADRESEAIASGMDVAVSHLQGRDQPLTVAEGLTHIDLGLDIPAFISQIAVALRRRARIS
jgi:hypothetical protein